MRTWTVFLIAVIGFFVTSLSNAQIGAGSSEVSGDFYMYGTSDVAIASVSGAYGHYLTSKWLIKAGLELTGSSYDFGGDDSADFNLGASLGFQYNFRDSGSTFYVKLDAYAPDVEEETGFGVASVGYRNYLNDTLSLDYELGIGGQIYTDCDECDSEALTLVSIGFTIFLP